MSEPTPTAGSRPVIIAIDGPAGAGKSTVARELAQALGFTLVDTGAIYRCLALLARRRGIPFDDASALEGLLAEVTPRFELVDGVNRVHLGAEDVSEAIRTPEISMGASTVSAQPAVRAGLLELQRRLALSTDTPGAVLEGRDIGTVVFPDADFKFFLTASAEERARRRHQELLGRGEVVAFEAVLAEQQRRDQQDRTREVAPLVPADDALEVDSSTLPADAVVRALVEWVRPTHGAP